VNDPWPDLTARFERLQALYQVSQVIHATLDSQPALELILREAVRLMRASSGSIVLVNPTTGFLEIQAAHALPPQALELKLRLGEGLTGWVARTGKPARVADVAQDPRYIMVRPNVRSELAVPLQISGEVRGAINVDSDRLDAFSQEDQAWLEDLAVQASSVIRNTWLYEQIKLKARLFESLVTVGQAINSPLSLDEALEVITREACVLMGTKMCSLLMLDETRQWLDLRASHGAGPAYISKPRLGVEDSLLGVVLRRKKALQVFNVQVSSRYQNMEIARTEGLVSLLSVPLVFQGQPTGALNVYTDHLHRFSNEEISILSALATLSAMALEKARLYDRTVQVEEQLRQSEKLSALGLLAAEVAHEIRNPLTVMKMLFHSLDLNFSPEDPRAQDVKIISDKMDQLNRIVEQILTFARRNEPQPAPTHLNPLIQDLALLLRHKLAHQGIQWECSLAADLPCILGDAAQLEQVFLNLALNAIEAMPQGGILTVSTRRSQGAEPGASPMIEVEFKDTGQGMTEEQQRRAFTSLLSTTKTKGTGLGLAMVGKIIEAHHGEIAIRSRPGGTTITIQLPAPPDETSESGPKSSS
jgi:signal transduction histidine kinase